MSRSPLSRFPMLALALALALVACSTAGTELDRAGGIDGGDGLPFQDDDPPPIGPEPPAPSADPDPGLVGPTFPEAPGGPTLTIAGDDGVWWLDPDGSAHLVVEPAVNADYDGAGGLVFQRSPTAPIVRRTAASVELDVVDAGDAELVHLLGVTFVDGRDQIIYLRTDGEAVTLERATVDGTEATMIVAVGRDGVPPERLALSGGYLTAVYRSGTGSGWVTWSLASGEKLFGTPDGEQGRCTAEPAPRCAEAVTVTADATTVLQVTPTEDDGLALVANRATDFAEIGRIDLQRPAAGWHVTSIEALEDSVIVNRSAAADGTGSLPALVVEPLGGEITQLPHVGRATVVAG